MNAATAAVHPSRRQRVLSAAAWFRGRRSPLVFDSVAALALAAFTIAGSIGESYPSKGLAGTSHVAHPPAAAYLLVGAAALALTWRRRRPKLVLGLSLAAVLLYTCLGYVDGAALLSPTVALYAVAVSVATRQAIALATVTMFALMAANAAFDPLGATGGPFPVIPGVVAAALLLGLWVASRRAFARREAEEETRRRVDAERLRIARELHDVIAHAMATINVQAGVAAHVLSEQPDQAADALGAIKAASKEGLRELRGILGVLRQADEPTHPTAPAPRLEHLEALIQSTTRAGLPTTLTVAGDPRPLPPTVDLTAYRIVQESLTNALRYAGPTRATVLLAYGDDELAIEIVDAGQGPRERYFAAGAGHGILGMRERAAAAGGELEAGPGPDRGFRVHARLPIETGR